MADADPRARRDDLVAVATVVVWTLGAVTSARWGIWFGVGSVALFAGIVMIVLDPLRLRSLFRPRPLALAVGLGAGVAMVGVTYELFRLAVRILPALRGATGDLYADFRVLPPVQAALALGPVIAGEELVWRGLVQGALARRIGPIGGVLIGALIYALAHAPVGSPLLTVVAFICGLFWGALRAATRSLLPPLIAHVMWDVSILLIWPLTAPR